MAMSCGVVSRHGSDLALLWWWCRLAATAAIGPLARELPDAMGVALSRQTDRQEGRKEGRDSFAPAPHSLRTVIYWHL